MIADNVWQEQFVNVRQTTLGKEESYREWLGERIEGMTGTLDGEGKGLWSLNTESLEKLYRQLWQRDPEQSYRDERLK